MMLTRQLGSQFVAASAPAREDGQRNRLQRSKGPHPVASSEIANLLEYLRSIL